MRFLGSRHDLFIRRIQPPIPNVFTDGIVEKKGVLADHPDVLSQRGLSHLSDIDPIHLDTAFLGIVKPQQQREKSAFTRTARAHQRIKLTGLEFQIDPSDRRPFQSPSLRICVMKREILKRDSPLRFAQRDRIRRIQNLRYLLDHLKDRRGRHDALLQDDLHAAQVLGRRVNLSQCQHDDEEILGTESPVLRIDQTRRDADGSHGFHDRPHHLRGLAPAHDALAHG